MIAAFDKAVEQLLDTDATDRLPGQLETLRSLIVAELDDNNIRAFPNVVGHCPMGCGRTLFLGAGGHITCSWVECPDPGNVDEMLDGARGMAGAALIAAQRARLAGDTRRIGPSDNQSQEIAWAAACYAAPDILLSRPAGSRFSERTIPALRDPWPWEVGDERMARPINPWHTEQAFHDQRRAELALAGALCAAELDRLQRFWAGDDEREVPGRAA